MRNYVLCIELLHLLYFFICSFLILVTTTGYNLGASIIPSNFRLISEVKFNISVTFWSFQSTEHWHSTISSSSDDSGIRMSVLTSDFVWLLRLPCIVLSSYSAPTCNGQKPQRWSKSCYSNFKIFRLFTSAKPIFQYLKVWINSIKNSLSPILNLLYVWTKEE